MLSDISAAQDMLEAKHEEVKQEMELLPHPADEKDASLMTDLKIISPAEEEYAIIEKHCQV